MIDYNLTQFDHIVITCQDLAKSAAFYRDVLGMKLDELSDGRVEAHFGSHKINLQPAGVQYGPPSNAGRTWTGNICIIAEEPVQEIAKDLIFSGVTIEEGPVRKIGAMGPIQSIYFRDPDENLIEISNYET